MQWHYKPFTALNTQELYDILALRQSVFVLEQKCLYQDLDYADQDALHLMLYQNKDLACYLRFFAPKESHSVPASFGRVVVHPSHRGAGLAKIAIQKILAIMDKDYAHQPLVISAQAYLIKFYTDFGFTVQGNPYDEDGIMHVKMIRRTAATSITDE